MQRKHPSVRVEGCLRRVAVRSQPLRCTRMNGVVALSRHTHTHTRKLQLNNCQCGRWNGLRLALCCADDVCGYRCRHDSSNVRFAAVRPSSSLTRSTHCSRSAAGMAAHISWHVLKTCGSCTVWRACVLKGKTEQHVWQSPNNAMNGRGHKVGVAGNLSGGARRCPPPTTSV